MISKNIFFGWGRGGGFGEGATVVMFFLLRIKTEIKKTIWAGGGGGG